MAESKKFYWLKLKRDFFKRHDIQIIEAMPNGKDYILFYLKLLCESVDHEGSLRFNDQIPYSEQMLATVTNTNIDIVRASIKVFTQLGMMEILDDGTIFMFEVQNMIGSAADNPNANRQRRFRESQKKQALQDRYGSVTENNESKSIDIDKELDIDTDKEKDSEKELYIGEFDVLWKRYPKKCGKQNAQKDYIKARKSGVDYDTISKGLDNYLEYIRVNKTEEKFIKHGSSWFHQHGWDDDYSTPKQESIMERLARL